MKERLTSNLGLKIISVLLAFFIWLVVVNVSNPEVTRSKEVQVEIENEQILTNANKTYDVLGKSTVTVQYDVRTRDEYKIKASDFHAYIDLAELYDITGSVPVKVEVLNNKELVENVTSKPGTIRIETEDMQRKKFDLEVFTIGQPADGYAVGSITMNPESVYVSGPTSQIGQISYVGIEMDLSEATESSSGIATPIYYDANNNKLPVLDRVSINQTDINYEIIIHKVKNINLNIETSGKAAAGYRFVGAECDSKSVSVVGLQSTLAEFNSITIPGDMLNVDGAATDRTVSVDLNKFIPEGVEIVGSPSTVEVILKIEPLVTRNIELTDSDITKTGTSDTLSYSIIPNKVSVTVMGLKADLESITPADLGASMDLSGMTLGSVRGVLDFKENQVYEVRSYSDFTIVVSASGPAANAANESQTEATGESTQETKDTETKATETKSTETKVAETSAAAASNLEQVENASEEITVSE